jgi:drug/metabolite transporter (DMT)-like permease
MNIQIKNKSLMADLSLFAVAAIWGSGFIATQMALDSKISPALIMTMRFTIATLAMIPLFYKSIRNISKAEIMIGLPAGILLFLGFLTQTVGLQFTTPSNNAFITSTNVIMVPFISWFLLKKAPKLKSFVLAAICLLGIGILTWTPGKGVQFNQGDFLTLLCAFLFAAHISYLDIASKKIPAGKLTFIQMISSAILSLMSLLFFDIDSIGKADFGTGFLPVLYLGLFSTFICFLIQTTAQKKTTSTKAAIFLSTEALFGSFLSVVIGLEALTSALLVGGAVIMGAIVLSEVNWKPLKLQEIPSSE